MFKKQKRELLYQSQVRWHYDRVRSTFKTGDGSQRPNKDNRCKTVQSKGFLSLEEELKSVLRKWLGSYVPVLTSKVVALSPEDAEELFSYLQKTLDDINATEFSKLRELQRSKSVEKTVAEIISGIAERGARWNNNIQKQYQDKLKSYSKEPKEQLTIDDI